jgi:hypothetical protein
MVVQSKDKFGKLRGVATVRRKDGSVEEVPFVVDNVHPNQVDKYLKGNEATKATRSKK